MQASVTANKATKDTENAKLKIKRSPGQWWTMIGLSILTVFSIYLALMFAPRPQTQNQWIGTAAAFATIVLGAITTAFFNYVADVQRIRAEERNASEQSHKERLSQAVNVLVPCTDMLSSRVEKAIDDEFVGRDQLISVLDNAQIIVTIISDLFERYDGNFSDIRRKAKMNLERMRMSGVQLTALSRVSGAVMGDLANIGTDTAELRLELEEAKSDYDEALIQKLIDRMEQIEQSVDSGLNELAQSINSSDSNGENLSNTPSDLLNSSVSVPCPECQANTILQLGDYTGATRWPICENGHKFAVHRNGRGGIFTRAQEQRRP